LFLGVTLGAGYVEVFELKRREEKREREREKEKTKERK